MNLTQSEITTFYKLWYSLVWEYNEKHKIIPHFKKPRYGVRVPISIEKFMKIRDSMWDNPEWIDEFLAEKDNGEFTEQERSIIIKWKKHFIKGTFLVVKHLSNYTVLMTFEGEPVYLYGVHGISDSFKDSFQYSLPFLINLVLVPWGDRIIYDSLATTPNMSFGAGLRSSIKVWSDISKEKYGIIEALGIDNPVAGLPKNKNSKLLVNSSAAPGNIPSAAKIPKVMAEKYIEIAEIITRFSKEKLNEEYQELCLKALAKLCRKRPSPLLKGRSNTWACGIVYAIGSNNFIFDKSQEINMTALEIAEWFGLSKSTAGNKAFEITNILQISPMRIEYSLMSL